MKTFLIKIVLIISVLFTSISYIGNTYAAGAGSAESTIRTSVSIDLSAMLSECKNDPEGTYYCDIPKGLSMVTVLLGKIIKYFTYIAALGGVLYIVINGILYSMGGIDQALKDDSKKRIVGTLVGLILLFLSGVILNLIAPWIYK